MFEIDLDSQEEGVWFEYLESRFDQETDEWVFFKPVFEGKDVELPKLKVRDPLPFVRKQLNKRGTTDITVFNKKANRMEIVSKPRELTQKEMEEEEKALTLYTLPEFSGFKDSKTGKIIECNEKTRIAMSNHPSVDRFIGRCIKMLRGIEVEKAKEEKKT